MTLILTRRSFLHKTMAAGVAVAATRGGPRQASAATTADHAPAFQKSKPDVIIHRGGYPGWPWVTRAGQRLVCVFRDDSVHGFSPSGKILWTDSRDNGKTWAPSRVVVDEPEVRLTYLPPPTDLEVERELDLDDLDTASHDGVEVDLEPLLREQLVLAVPIKPVCQPECKGICPNCGTDLNKKACGCNIELPETNPWKRALKQLGEEN